MEEGFIKDHYNLRGAFQSMWMEGRAVSSMVWWSEAGAKSRDPRFDLQMHKMRVSGVLCLTRTGLTARKLRVRYR